MRLLLDTHPFLWWLAGSSLNSESIEAIGNEGNTVYVSAASIWEAEIKRKVGKLQIDFDLRDDIADNGFLPLPITLDHAASAANLEMLHRDPFDRMLIAQAIAEDMTLVTSDARIRQYPGVELLTC